ncbi:MAG: bile acid:sodium symporter family protein [Victivallales bacterium]|nr:bile acid:sodium symporter family protein [Victivallales bacterium]
MTSETSSKPLFQRILDGISKSMALLVVLAGVLAFCFPSQIQSVLPTSCIPWMLGVVMFGMGLTLKGRDFALVLKRPLDVGIGVLAQFILMPLVAWILAKVLRLSPELTLGVVLVGTCPGGTASNVIAYLAKGDVALSVTMTSCSTLLAPVMTPLLTQLYTGESIQVPTLAMFLSIVKIVIAPIVIGVLVNEFLPQFSARVQKGLPAFSSLVVAIIVAAVVAASAANILRHLGLILLVVILHNLLGMVLGYLAGRLTRMDTCKSRTLAIEVGMQNSGLATSLAALHFANYPLATVPGALFSVWHNISGALFANYCNWKSSRTPQDK